ncbi:unnamed protein product [Gongylonema pulchrum]|uniref:Uncharacterized protein n=1 Tax=Gongylonema pulchrum TaxID=637853 RepID=A0A183D089_9BILA|nr:unnamed protein product [Gongylonema pulchrum]
MMEVMLKLKGQTGTLAKNRLHYAVCSVFFYQLLVPHLHFNTFVWRQ